MLNTSLCYIEQGDRYLMLHRVKKKNDLNKDKWIGIGGKFEPGESPEECMCREMQEETGLTAQKWRCRGIVTFVQGDWTEYMHLFTVQSWSGKMHPCDEGELAWIEKRALMDMDIWEGDRIFLRLLEDTERPFFSLKLTYKGEKLLFAALDGRELSRDSWDRVN